MILLVFTLTSGPHYVLQSFLSLQVFIAAYFFPKSSGQIAWPEIFTTIIEAQTASLQVKLERVHGFLPVTLAGFAGLAYLYVVQPKRMIPVTPLILIGLWSLVGPRRFAMYLAPFIGIGVGVLIELAVRQVLGRFKSNRLAPPVIALTLMVVLFFSTAGYTAYDTVPQPIVPAETLQAFLDIKRIVPKHSAMFTWWDRGYPLMEVGGFATYHDGALQGYSRTTLVGKAVTSSHQEELVSLLSYLEDHGFAGLDAAIEERNLSADQMLQEVFNYPKAFQGDDVYILYTDDMIEKFGCHFDFRQLGL